MNEPIAPIRDGVVIAFDTERELIDFFVTQVKRFIDGAGQPPTRIAVALMGKGADEKFHTRANSWDTREETCRTENCGVAATLFLQRALGDE